MIVSPVLNVEQLTHLTGLIEFNPSIRLVRRLKRTFDELSFIDEKSVFDELFVQARRAIRVLFVPVLYRGVGATVKVCENFEI